MTNGSSPFTGLFESGADYGLIRLSLASKPSSTHMTPGFGLKFLRDGIDSANLVAMYRVAGQDNWNFFANDFSNHIPGETASTLLKLAKKFSTVTKWVAQVGISDFA